eukprot:645418-Prorocentrum_minimum.AAC.2
MEDNFGSHNSATTGVTLQRVSKTLVAELCDPELSIYYAVPEDGGLSQSRTNTGLGGGGIPSPAPKELYDWFQRYNCEKASGR